MALFSDPQNCASTARVARGAARGHDGRRCLRESSVPLAKAPALPCHDLRAAIESSATAASLSV